MEGLSRERHILHARAEDALLALSALGFIVGGELAIVEGDPAYGLAGYATLLVLFLSLGSLLADRRQGAFFLALSVVPVLRIGSLSIPIGDFPRPYWYLLTAIPPLLGAIQLVRRLRLSPTSIGLRFATGQRLVLDLVVAASGVGIGWLAWRILRPAPVVDRGSVAWLIATCLIILVATGFAEELLFRGIVQHVSEGLLGRNRALIFTAVLSGLLELGWGSALDVLLVVGMALYFGAVIRYTGSLLGVSVAHGTANIMLLVVLPLSLTSHHASHANFAMNAPHRSYLALKS